MPHAHGPGFSGLRLHNTLTRQKEPFVPLDWDNPAVPEDKRRVRIYVCGPTVYDFAHIGNARPLIVFDVLYRLLRHLYGPDRVTYVRNITDVDDKIIARAANDYPDLPLNDAIRKVTEETEAQFHADAAALGCLKPTHEPRATEHIGAMRAMIERLVDKGHAYVAEEHVLFHVPSMPDYGRLSGRSTDELIAGARVEVAPYKRDPMDFVLWKPSKPGEPAWDSPCGIATPGRPGWHIECSAMAEALLGKTFDIHGGGIDLVFPHHENEIAQSRCAHGTDTMARYWLHNGYLQVEGAKMSKSLGNFVTVRELLEDWPGEVIRINMLKTHYRQPMDWTVRGLEESEKIVEKLYRAVGDEAPSKPYQPFIDELSDDLNTPNAFAILFVLGEMAMRGGQTTVGKDPMLYSAASVLRATADLVGLLPETAGERRTRLQSVLGIDETNVQSHIAARAEARKRKDWAEADRIRDELEAMGIALKDSKDPETGELVTTWELKR